MSRYVQDFTENVVTRYGNNKRGLQGLSTFFLYFFRKFVRFDEVSDIFRDKKLNYRFSC